MKKKLNQQSGFTLVEMLAVTVILILLTMMLGTGLNMTVNSYQKLVAHHEVELLLSTAMDALADDLRFAQDFQEIKDSDPDPDPEPGIDPDTYVCVVPFTYVSDSFAGKIHLELDSTGQIRAKNIEPDEEGNFEAEGKLFLSTGAYGVKKSGDQRAYQVTVMEIEPDTDNNTFKITLEVQAIADESIKAGDTVTIHCLNKM